MLVIGTEAAQLLVLEPSGSAVQAMARARVRVRVRGLGLTLTLTLTGCRM